MNSRAVSCIVAVCREEPTWDQLLLVLYELLAQFWRWQKYLFSVPWLIQPGWAFGGSPPKQSSKHPQIETWHTVNQLSSIFRMSSTPAETQSPPVENFLATVLIQPMDGTVLTYFHISLLRGALHIFPGVLYNDWSCNKSSGAGGGGASAPQKFWFVENLGKIHQNPSKIPENMDKTLENPGTNDVQRCLISKNGAQRFQKNTWRPSSNFSGKFWEIRANILYSPKNFAPTPMNKSIRRTPLARFPGAKIYCYV